MPVSVKLTGTHAEQWPLWYHPLISFMQVLTCRMVSEEKHCPAVNTLGLACNKFEFRGNKYDTDFLCDLGQIS